MDDKALREAICRDWAYTVPKQDLIDRIEGLEAKLAECEARLEKTVELAFDECPFRDGTGSYNDWWHYRRKELEALKGQNDE